MTIYWIEDDPWEARARPSENLILSADWCEGEPADWSVTVAHPNHPADDFSFVTVGRGESDTLDAAKLAAETFAREWIAKQAAALGDGWIPVGERLPKRGVAVLAVYVSPIRSDRRIDVMWNGYNGWHAGGAESVTVTHWRPLPPPPVAEVEE